MYGAILSIGSELLRGDIIDTNAAYLARELTLLGVEVLRVQAVPDNQTTLEAAVRSCMEFADVTLCTGGLGPTGDDLTREAIAAVFAEHPEPDPELVAVLKARFASMQRRMTANNNKQAWLIPSAIALPNPNGTAPGWFAQRGGRVLAALPGPPAEMEPMWREQVRPRLASRLLGARSDLALMTFGLGESLLEHQIEDLLRHDPAVTVATYAKAAGVQVHISARGVDAAQAEQRRETVERLLRSRLGTAIYGSESDTLAAVVGRVLQQHRLSIATMESATGGDVAALITGVEGSSSYFRGGIVAYSRSIKEQFGVPPTTMDRNGLVSAATAVAMAGAIRDQLHVDIGVATTGVAGGEAVEGHPPGTCFVAVTDAQGEMVQEVHRPGRRDTIKRYFAQCALDLVRRRLLGTEGDAA